MTQIGHRYKIVREQGAASNQFSRSNDFFFSDDIERWISSTKTKTHRNDSRRKKKPQVEIGKQ